MINLINDMNRIDIQSQYVDHIVGSLDFIEARNLLRNYIEYEKDSLSNEDLYVEIIHEAPYILVNNIDEILEEVTHA